MPAGGPPILYAYRVPDPTRFAEVTLTEALKERGVVVNARGATRPDFGAIKSSYSPDRMVAEQCRRRSGRRCASRSR